MEFFESISRYALPALTVLLAGMCVSTLWLGHPLEKTYAYLINMNDGETHQISMWETSIGRKRYCDIVLNGSKIAPSNAVITRRIDGWYIHSLDAKFPLKVNGAEVEKSCTITNGDIINIGTTSFRFEVIDDPVQSESRRARKAQVKAMKKAQQQQRSQNTPEQPVYSAAQTARSTQLQAVRRGYVINNDSVSMYCKSPLSSEVKKFNANKTVTIGSSPRSDIRISEPGVMGIHGRIVHYREGWAIERTVDSQIYVNGKRIAQRKLLQNGDTIILGAASILYRQR